jgi:hypothetical protein
MREQVILQARFAAPRSKRSDVPTGFGDPVGNLATRAVDFPLDPAAPKQLVERLLPNPPREAPQRLRGTIDQGAQAERGESLEELPSSSILCPTSLS